MEVNDGGVVPFQRRKTFDQEVLTVEQLRSLPRPEPLIEDTVDKRTVTVLAGPWASGKSFIALDWALCIASGKPWQGRPVRELGKVLYVAAEGAYGLAQRIEAWSAAWRCPLPEADFLVYPKPVNLMGSNAVAELIAYAWANGIMLVVFDTLARCMVGADENSARDMGVAVEALYAVRHATLHQAGSVVAVHHTGKDRSTVRGSSALEAGTDSVFQLETNDSAAIKLTRTKRKDGPRGKALPLKLSVRGESCIVESHAGDGLTGNEETLQSTLQSHFSNLGEIAATTLMDVSGVPKSSFYKALNSLADKGIVTLRKQGQSKLVQLAGSTP